MAPYRLPMGRTNFLGVLPVSVGSTVTILKFLIIFEQGASCFHFATGPTNCEASPAHRDPLAWPLLPASISLAPLSSLTLQTLVTSVHQSLEVVPASEHLHSLFPCLEHHPSPQEQLSSAFSKLLLILQI